MNDQSPARREKSHGAKRQLLGNPASQVAPAWKANITPLQGITQSDKILLSKLPTDIRENEIEELFQKTVGPVKECILIYNSQGKSKGMAITTFQRPGDAIVARTKYNGKIVDGRHTLKIEIIYDVSPSSTGLTNSPSLLNRIVGQPSSQAMNGPLQSNRYTQPLNLSASSVVPVMPVAPTKYRKKKGPKRLKKRQAATKDELDKELDSYRAAGVNNSRS